ncbi:DUF4062 domain-containing protein [Sulfitobacter pontiacus]
MSGKVRVFVSSTMEDLANERAEVVQQIKDIGLEPVNAEGVLPNGGTSWDVLANEIASSHIFVLILGGRYGWIPTSGYGKGSNKSVSHLELDYARLHGLPILPFQKRLSYGADSTSDDAKRRDTFRSEVGEWDDGHFRQDFDLAIDLGKRVRAALIDVFQDTFLKRQVKKAQSSSQTSRAEFDVTFTTSKVADQIEERGMILFAGAGFSVAAGYPTASSLAEVLGQRAGLDNSGPEILARHSFADIASYAETKLGRVGMTHVVQELLDTALPVEPTKAHFLAVQSFRAIVTTNYDLLFERACEMAGIPFKVVLPLDDHMRDESILEIYKVDGSIDQAETLRLTRCDFESSSSNSMMWKSISALLESYGLVVAGHSLRGPTGQNILSRRNTKLPGYYVSPNLDELDVVTLTRYNLEGIRTTADDFMETLLPQR